MSGDELFPDAPRQAENGVKAAGQPRMREPVRDQIELRAVDLEALVPPNHPVRVIWAYVEKLDLRDLREQTRAREHTPGQAAVSPSLYLALWLYATSEGIGSARALARLCESHDVYRWLCGGVSVNYHGLADFRTTHPELLDRLLSENVASLSVAGVIDLDEVAQDGVRVRASAGTKSFRRRKKLHKELKKARRLIEQLKQEMTDDPQASSRRIMAAKERAAREREYGSLTEDRDFLVAASPLTHIDAIGAPLFIQHGLNDPRVPVGESQHIAGVLAEKGIRCELVIYDDEGHTIEKLSNRIDCFTRAAVFLDEVLGA